ncbi:hypothetical protein DYH09_18045 [bacterium CPR1]|nr:hypothetical protein [bacterium CPR1]
MSTVYGAVNTYAYSGHGIPAGSVASGYTTGADAPSVLSLHPAQQANGGQATVSKDYLPVIAVSIQRERQLFTSWTGVGGAPPVVLNSLPDPRMADQTPRQTIVTQSEFAFQQAAFGSFPFLGPFVGQGGLPAGPFVLGPFSSPGGLPQGPNVLGPFGGPGGLPQGPNVLGPFGGPGGLPQGPNVLGPFGGPGGLPQGPNVLGPFGGPGGLPFASPGLLGPFGGPGGLPFGSPNVLGPFGGPGGLPAQSPPLLGPPSFGAPNGTFPFAGQFNGGGTAPFPFPQTQMPIMQPLAAVGGSVAPTTGVGGSVAPTRPCPFPTTTTPVTLHPGPALYGGSQPAHRAGWGWQDLVAAPTVDPVTNDRQLSLEQRQSQSGFERP